MIIQGATLLAVFTVVRRREGEGGDTSVRHPELASVRFVMRGNYERGKGNINVLVSRLLGSLTLCMLCNIDLTRVDIRDFLTRAPEPRLSRTNSLVIPLEGAEPGSGHNRCTPPHTSLPRGQSFYESKKI